MGIHTIAPGHPPIVKITTSHKLSSKDLVVSSSRAGPDPPLVSNNFGRNTLNIVYAAHSIHQHKSIHQKKGRSRTYQVTWSTTPPKPTTWSSPTLSTTPSQHDPTTPSTVFVSTSGASEMVLFSPFRRMKKSGYVVGRRRRNGGGWRGAVGVGEDGGWGLRWVEVGVGMGNGTEYG
jgi:hypothetical protein